MGTCLARCGVDTTQIPGVEHCWLHDASEGHILRAEQLAKGLINYSIAGIQKVRKIDPENFSTSLHGKTGIVFFKDYWQREINGQKESFRNRSGDHIDLWNINRITDWKSWVRIHLRIGRFGLHSLSDRWSDYEASKAVWFWRVL